MSEIALFNLLKRIPDATEEEVEKAVADVASSKDVVTKTDIVKLEGFIKEGFAKINTELKYLRWLIVIVAGIVIGVLKFL